MNYINTLKLSMDSLDQVSGGTPGLVVPCLPGIPYVTVPGDTKKDEDGDGSGGYTFTW